MNVVYLSQGISELTFVKDVFTKMSCADMAGNTESAKKL